MRKLIIYFFVLFNTFPVYAQHSHLLFEAKFIDGSVTRLFSLIAHGNNAAAVTDSVERHPNETSMKLQVKPNANGLGSQYSVIIGKPETSSERWYGFTVYAPADYLPDPEEETISNWHSRPDFDLGETWTSPYLALQTENGHWKLTVRWDTAKVTKQLHWMGEIISDFGPVKLNKWTDWVFHIKFSYEADGIVEVYKDGVKIYRRQGPNILNNVNMPYWEIGIAKWGYTDATPQRHKFTQRRLFFSSLREGDENASYKDVAP
jgi:hypothetical protein